MNWVGRYKYLSWPDFDIPSLLPPLPSQQSFASLPAPISRLPLMVYIPFVSLLGIQAALDSFAPKTEQPVLEADSVTPVHFINPKPGGGSWLDKDAHTGLGEPLNVSLSPAVQTNLELTKNQVIISGLSTEWVLSDGGFVHYANALGL